MKKIHYYFGWFTKTIPQKLADMLNIELVGKKSLVAISTAPDDAPGSDSIMAFVKDVWFEPAGVVFQEYHSIDYRVNKNEAADLIKNASAILLHGGKEIGLREFIEEYGLQEAIGQSSAPVIMGGSAGGMNMGAKFTYNDYDKVYDGLALDNLMFTPHAVEKELENETKFITLSNDLDVYAGCEESALRIEGDDITVIGDVFKISKGKIIKI
ncbi:MAG: Type 1 glutamine amidotransferase-like domain-containing protein [Defluviitaleaceae bacterium]|nr:Type 1 glutamine amidotransferase-like domain-containing protein [Defluviitaleaceae bacterium]